MRVDEAQPMRDGLTALPFLLIPYDSVAHLVGGQLSTATQTLPATALFSVVYLVIRRTHVAMTGAGGRVLQLICASILTIAAVTAFNLLFESVTTGADLSLRLRVVARQGASLLLGLTTFLMFLDALQRRSLASAMRLIAIGATPSLVLAMLQLAGGDFRAQGFSSEPSHFADMLIFGFLPALWIATRAGLTRSTGLIAGGASLLATFSTTGFLKAGLAASTYFATRGWLLRGIAIMCALLVAGYFVLAHFPDNYVFLVLSYMYTAYTDTGDLVTGSFIDRFFGLAGPLATLDSLHGWLGFGLGGDTVYFDRLFSPEVADAIRAVKSDVPAISSLQGKLLMYGGVIGYTLYVAGWWQAFSHAPRGHLCRIFLPTLFLASLFSMGPFFLPYTWLWLAIAVVAARETQNAC